MLSSRELEREAKILARRLVKQKAWLEEISRSGARSTLTASQEKWIIVSAKTSGKSKITPIDSQLVDGMRSACWLKGDPSGSLRLSAPGAEKLLNAQISNGFSNQHQDRMAKVIKDCDGRTISVTANQAESPLGWMRARKDKAGKPLLSQVQFEAGERIRRDFTLAQMSPRVTSSWEFSSPAGSKKMRRDKGVMEISEQAMAAKSRFFAALDILGPEMSGVVYEVCCLASGLEAAERQFNWPRRSAKLVLQIALGKLSEHYGFVRPTKDNQKPGFIRHWGQDGYRPVISPSQTS